MNKRKSFITICTLLLIITFTALFTACSLLGEENSDTETQEQGSFTIQVQTATGGSISASRTKAEPGEPIHLTYKENEGYTFFSYTVKDSQDNEIPVTDSSFLMPQSNVTVSGTFVKISTNAYMVVTSHNDHAYIDYSLPSGKGDMVFAGTRVQLTLDIYDTNVYRLDHWTVTDDDQNEVLVTNGSFVMPESNVTISVTLEEVFYTLTVDSALAGKCTITVSDSTDNVIQAHYGDSVQIICTPKEGYDFNNWQVQDANGRTLLNSRSNSVYFTVRNTNVTISASLSPRSYTLKIDSYDSLKEFYVMRSNGTKLSQNSYAYCDEELTVVFTCHANYNLSALHIRPWEQRQYGYESSFIQYGADLAYDENYRFIMPAKNVHITAETTLIRNNEYHITYNTGDDVTNPNSISSFLSGDDPFSLEDAERPGYIFDYWMDQNENPIIGIEPSEVDEDLTLTPIWETICYHVEFDANGGEGDMEDIRYLPYDEEWQLTPNAFTKDYYEFAGWATSEDGEAVFADKQSVCKLSTTNYQTVILYAVWTPITYTLTYSEDGTESTLSYTILDEITIKQSSKTGYSFDYFTVTTADGNWEEDTVLTAGSKISLNYGNATLTAHYTINQYTITFVFDNGEDDLAITQDYATEIQEPEDPGKAGCSFNGWDKAIPTTMPAENLTITARWNSDDYTITYYDKGDAAFTGEHDENYPTTYTWGSSVTLDTPDRTGYRFGGYYLNSNCTGEAVTAFREEAFDSKTIKLYAKWTPITYVISYRSRSDSQGTNTMGYQQMTYDTPAHLKANEYVEELFDFVGWTTDFDNRTDPTPNTIMYKDCEEVVNLSTTQGEEVILYSQWVHKTYTLTRVVGDTETSVNYQQTNYWYPNSLDLTAPAKEGYTFLHWEVTEGELYGKVYLNYNSPPDTAIYRYTPSSNSVIADVRHYDVYGTATITAVYEPTEYAITFLSGETTVGTITQGYGTAINAESIPADPTKAGYSFDGWDTEIPATMPLNGLTIRATWQVKEYDLQYKTVGGGEIQGATFENYPTKHKYNEDTALVFPVKEGYNAVGWFTASDGSGDALVTLAANQVSAEGDTLILYVRFEEQLFTYSVNANSSLSVTGLTVAGATQPTLAIPAYNNGVRVQGIAANAFTNNLTIRMLTIPSTVTSIGKNALTGMRNLSELVNLSSVSLSSGTNGTFSNPIGEIYPAVITNESGYVSHLQRATNGVYYYVNGNEKIACLYDGNESDLELDSDCTKIRGYAFYGGAGFTTFTVPASVTKVDRYAFQDCTDLETLYWNAVNGEMAPLTGASASTNCFYGCDALSSIEFGEGVMVVPYNIGSQLSSLTDVQISASVKWIRSNAFAHCVNLQNVTIADGSILESIGAEAFTQTAITAIALPDKITSIASGTFSYCASLTSITIPKNVTSIADSAFMGCTSLETITVEEENTAFDTRSGLNCLINTSHVLVLGAKNTVIPSDVTAIGSFAFYGNGLTSITIPGNVKTIGTQAFRACASLTSLTIEEGVESIGSYAFANCTALENLTLPNSLQTIESSAFNRCEALLNVHLSAGLTNVGYSVFDYCSKIQKVYIQNAYIYNGATDPWERGLILYYAKEVYVLQSVYEDANNANAYLTNTEYYTQPTGLTNVNGTNYYLFTKIVS